MFYICKKKFEEIHAKDIKYRKYRDHCYYAGEYIGVAYSECNLKYSVPKEIPIVFHNGSNYDYHFIIKELAEKLKNQFICLGENTEKYITFSVPMQRKVTRIDKYRKKNTKTISYRLKFIDSTRFIVSSL